MKLTDFFLCESFIHELQATERNGVIRELVSSLAAHGAIDPGHVENVSKIAIKRENEGSTGFGKGVAVPHVKFDGAKRMVATIGRSSVGVDFAALDRAPVYTVVLLVSPLHDPDSHLAAMEQIFKHMRRENFRRFLRQADSREAIIDMIREADEIAEE
ncbi:MAG: PTS sugar transporter subunit IIA [Phycisphaerales bacterium]|nr:PTS sugar transporter subunit IIA [Phycisphaerales bacterium]